MTIADDRVVVDLAEESRYDRQELVSWWDQDRLSSAKVLVAGAGALGNELVKCLTLLGVGQISLVDFDHVERSNLSRAVLMREEDIGRPKAEVVAERAIALNPDVEVTPYVGDLRAHFGIGRVADYDVVLGGLDSRIARLRLNAAAFRARVPFVDGAIEGIMGVVRVFRAPDSACYECTLTDRDMELLSVRRSCAMLTVDEIETGKVPTTATTASIVAGIQVQEAVKLLHDAPGADALVGKALMLNGLNHDSYVVEYVTNEDCLAHDTFDVAALERIAGSTEVSELVSRAVSKFGNDAYVQFEDEIVNGLRCDRCSYSEPTVRSSVRFARSDLVCPDCSSDLTPIVVNRVGSTEESVAKMTLAALALPEGDIVTLMSGSDPADREVLVVGADQ